MARNWRTMSNHRRCSPTGSARVEVPGDLVLYDSDLVLALVRILERSR